MSESPPPLPPANEDREAQRLQALLDYGVGDTEPEAAFDELTQLASQLFGMPIALVTLLDRDRVWFKARVGTTARESSREVSICNLTIDAKAPVVVHDTWLDSRLANNPQVTGDTPIRFYAGAPLNTPEGFTLGALCVIDHQPREFSDQQRDTLMVLARQVLAQLELRRQNRLLAAALEATHAERTRLRQVLNDTSDGSWEMDLSTGGGHLSASAWALLGQDEREQPVPGQDLAKLLHPVARLQMRQQVQTAIASADARLVMQAELRHQAGHEVPVLIRGHIQRDAAGRATRIAGTLTDLAPVRRAELQRVEVQKRYLAVVETSLDGVLLSHPGKGLLAANAAACNMLGHTEAELLGFTTADLLDPTDPRGAQALATKAAKGQVRSELRLLRSDGLPIDVEFSASVHLDGDGKRVSSMVIRDITEKLALATRTKASLDLLNNLAARVPGVLYQFCLRPDGSSYMPFASPNLHQVYGVWPDEVSDSTAVAFSRIHPDDLEGVHRSIMESAKTLKPWRDEHRVLLPGRGLLWLQGDAQPELLPDGSVLWHGYITDITARKAIETQLHKMAHFDALTGLANRHQLMERLGEYNSAARRHGHCGAVLFIDLDNFKQVNDAKGHAVGDQILQRTAERLSRCVRREDLVARLGGDEFVVLLGALSAHAESAAFEAAAVAAKVGALLAEPHEIEGEPYRSTASVGITLFPRDELSPEQLMREADIAMYQAKAQGRNSHAMFEQDMQIAVERRLALQIDLRRAIDAETLMAHVQPQFGADGRVVGGELLLRWHDPVRGSISPGEFIPLAEETGLIMPLGDWIMRQACQALAQMQAAGLEMPLSVNVSPRQFHDAGFSAQVRAALHSTGARADRLILEITEGLLVKRTEAAIERMHELTALGLRFSIDDFGTGYSSLAYLRSMPLYEVKIDQSFVRHLPGDAGDTAIVQSILSMAHHLGLHVVAEGVETAEQAAFLRLHQCSALQGFHFARPQALAGWLAAMGCTPAPGAAQPVAVA